MSHDGITPQTFSQAGVVYQIGVAPVRVDILTQVTGVRFSDAWKNRVESSIFEIPVKFISLRDLIANKQAAGRDQDLADLRQLPPRT